MQGWTVSTDQSIGKVQRSDVETLLVSGTLDGSTPMQYPRDELLPYLSKGHQVIIGDQAHTETFWHSQPLARARLLNTFFDTGEVDDSLFQYQAPVFDVDTSWSGLAKMVLAAVVIVLGILLLLIVVLARRFSRKFWVNKMVDV